MKYTMYKDVRKYIKITMVPKIQKLRNLKKKKTGKNIYENKILKKII